MKLKSLAALVAVISSAPAFASFDFEVTDGHKISFGGYFKADARFVDGEVAFQPWWGGKGKLHENGESKSQFRMYANESRINTKYQHGDVTAFIEMDFYGADGNQKISNSYDPRLRHAYIQYKNVLAGQTWTTFMNTSALPESADFAGSLMGESFVRQSQLRLTYGGLQVSVENPETFGAGGDPSEDGLPDVIAKYTFKGGWGNFSASVLTRELNFEDGESEMAVGGGIAGRINTFGKDDLRFQFHTGELGRYVGAGAVADGVKVGNEWKAEKSTAYNIAYRHFWNKTVRSNVFYGYIEADEADTEVSQWGVNVMADLTDRLTWGAEVGNHAVDNGPDNDGDSFYGQVFMKFSL